jgi:hypothetical protein
MPLDPEVKEVIRKVRDEVLTSPDRWAQGANARTSDGSNIDPTHIAACCWCLNGAIVVGGYECDLYRNVYLAVAGRHGRTISEWNDASERTFDDVRSLLDRALSEGRDEPIHG